MRRILKVNKAVDKISKVGMAALVGTAGIAGVAAVKELPKWNAELEVQKQIGYSEKVARPELVKTVKNYLTALQQSQMDDSDSQQEGSETNVFLDAYASALGQERSEVTDAAALTLAWNEAAKIYLSPDARSGDSKIPRWALVILSHLSKL